jgi:hypothetical protein
MVRRGDHRRWRREYAWSDGEAPIRVRTGSARVVCDRVSIGDIEEQRSGQRRSFLLPRRAGSRGKGGGKWRFSGWGEGGKRKQEKGTVSRQVPSDCLHIVFLGDMSRRARDILPGTGGNPPFLVRDYETRSHLGEVRCMEGGYAHRPNAASPERASILVVRRLLSRS